ncbi:hypothetical protein DOTSEDRAFT_27279 [Dothistroma septosporum NZE10]|uniref:Uncharacterized protein n=1 Tax=Dothistroma septosporum (strain NZE10 / CBS 128990) TaxID=675120 RepID=N1PE78_DOTSN|nr:hypothetical protein DOTSEDRAFT_27279 [Dothistroma septosporum NZE10]
MADEALDSFKALLQSVPGWIADLESILKQAADRQEEILFETHPGPREHSPRETPKPKSKSSSLKSSRSHHDSTGQGDDRSKPTLLKRRSLKHLTSSDALRLSQRKRKTTSVASVDQSGPPKFRTKAAAVVYYDGDTQKRFEKLVRAVGSSRNAIRKGKMGAKVDCLGRTGSSSSEASNSSGGEEDAFSPLAARLNIKSTRSPRPGVILGRNADTEVFDKVDAKLERAQALCERAAHQILRDGDCTLEVTNARENFAEAVQLAEEELPTLQKRAEKAAARRRRSEERHSVEEEEADAKAEAHAEAEQKRRSDLSQQIIHAVVAAGYASEPKLEVDRSEADDLDDDEGEFDIGAMKMGRFTHMRRSPLPIAAA